MDEPQPTLLETFDEIPEPCLRIPFQSMLSINNVLGFGLKWQIARGMVDTWGKNARQRGCEILRARGVALEPVEIVKEGKPKPMKDGSPGKVPRYYTRYERAVETIFREPTGIMVRIWRPNATPYDIHNLFIKPVLDGFVDINILPDDQSEWVPQLGFDFRGVDRDLAFTAVEREARKEFQQERLDKGKKRKPLPVRSRIWFDFYRMSRVETGSMFSFKIK